jgi:muramoyltetrapeptide carboxypeptidase
MIKPRRLQSGATIGIIAPASPPLTDESLQKGVTYLEKQGFRVLLGESIGARRGYLAGADQDRVNDLHRMFSDPHVDAILAVRGGYGSSRLLPLVDYELIKRNPKIFVGYSDITALHCAIYRRTQMVTFAGPMLAADFGGAVDPDAESFFWPLLMGDSPLHRILCDNADIESMSIDRDFTGPLLGGNLSIICSLLGTPFLPDCTGAVLALEEIGEAPYRIDRMLNQLKLSGIFDQLSGLLVGQFTNCVQKNEQPSLTLDEIFHDYFAALSVPAVRNIPFGHEKQKVTLPLGTFVRYEPSARTVTIVDSPVV